MYHCLFLPLNFPCLTYVSVVFALIVTSRAVYISLLKSFFKIKIFSKHKYYNVCVEINEGDGISTCKNQCTIGIISYKIIIKTCKRVE